MQAGGRDWGSGMILQGERVSLGGNTEGSVALGVRKEGESSGQGLY